VTSPVIDSSACPVAWSKLAWFMSRRMRWTVLTVRAYTPPLPP
jgi:hypothetical protein